MFRNLFTAGVAAIMLVMNVTGARVAFSAEPVIVAYGDSTTALRKAITVYPTLVENGLATRGVSAKVINAAVPGNTTADARTRLERDIVVHNPSLVIIQFGINDAAVDVWRTPPATLPRVSPKQYEKNLRYLIQTIKGRGAEVVLMTPNPCRWSEETRRLYGKPPYRLNDSDGFNILLRGYAKIVRQVAQQENATLVDVDQAFRAYGEVPGQSVDDLLLDGMHPNGKGHELVARLLLALEQLLGN